MAETPDEVYERVLAEEQAKGSSPPVAEGRAKSARFKARRAQEGGGSDGQAAPAQEAQEPAAQPAAAEAKGGDGQQPAAAGQEAPAAEAKEAAQPAGGGEDPEEVYNRVLSEEQSKGSSPAVAEARAKAARHRARKGTPQPAVSSAASAPAKGAPAKEKEAAPAAASAAEPAAAEAPTGRRAAAAAAIAPGAPSPERMQRLLAVVKPEAIQRVEKEPMDRVNAWPHLMASEFLALLAVTAFLVVFSTFIDAPFRELANINTTPNPSKAPWYFLGLQELLRYFHPQIAGVTIPQWLILGWIAAPYIDRNPSSKPEDRKLAISLWTMFVLMFAILTILGSLFRGPGFNFIYPWDQGLFFEL